jgi:hypothetical protein
MNNGQYRVLVLLIVLAFLEIAIHPAFHSFFTNVRENISGSIQRNIKVGNA